MASRYEGLFEGLVPRRPTLDRRVLLNHIRGYGVAAMFIAMFVALAITTSAFLTTDNLRNLLEQSAQIGLIACGATLVIIAGQFDLSSGAIYSFAGVVAIIVTGESTVVLGMLAGLVSGVVIGFANGLLVTRVGIDSFLATLASGFVLVGLGIVVASGLWNRAYDRGRLRPAGPRVGLLAQVRGLCSRRRHDSSPGSFFALPLSVARSTRLVAISRRRAWRASRSVRYGPSPSLSAA